MRLKGKKAIVTGAGRGIGRAISVALAREGVETILVSRTELELKETQKLISQTGVDSQIERMDVGSESGVEDFFRKINAQTSSLDYLINNAGFAQMIPFEETTPEIWNKTLEVNLSSVYRMTRLALPLLKKAGSSIVINIASVAGMSEFEKFPGFAAYSAAKAGVIVLGEVMAKELASDGVSVYSVSPGAVDTRMLHDNVPDLKADLMPEDIADQVMKIIDGKVKEPSGANIVIAEKAKG